MSTITTIRRPCVDHVDHTPGDDLQHIFPFRRDHETGDIDLTIRAGERARCGYIQQADSAPGAAEIYTGREANPDLCVVCIELGKRCGR